MLFVTLHLPCNINVVERLNYSKCGPNKSIFCDGLLIQSPSLKLNGSQNSVRSTVNHFVSIRSQVIPLGKLHLKKTSVMAPKPTGDSLLPNLYHKNIPGLHAVQAENQGDTVLPFLSPPCAWLSERADLMHAVVPSLDCQER